jgi:SAM-dependent methyltransferase
LTGRLADYCAFAPGARVVDIGCGTGITVEYLRDSRKLEAVGVDLAEARLLAGSERSPGLPLMLAAGEALPFADQSADGVFAECSLSVMQHAGKVLDECSRILVPGGKLALTDIYSQSGCSAAAGDLAKRTGGIMTGDELAVMLAQAGFGIIVWEDCSFLLREFIARFIMEHGPDDDLWHCIAITGAEGYGCRTAAKLKLGYYLLVAEKRRNPQ